MNEVDILSQIYNAITTAPTILTPAFIEQYRKRKRDSAVETASIQTMSAGRRLRDKREFRSVEILDRALI